MSDRKIGDIRRMYESAFVFAWDLQGRDVTVTIRDVVAEVLTSTGGKQAKKPVIYFEGNKKGLALNKTNMRTIGSMYGFRGEDWIGKRITIYGTVTEMSGRTVDCVRVRPGVPVAKSEVLRDNVPVDEAMRAKQNEAAEALDGDARD